ncbi:hypothetical protein MJM83_32560, partial [Salmonella enterica subsp. enterica serovar Montevideo]|nr:hypothetical protein [Salmonella enterica subsp. enterica serovar Montevideo]
LLTPDLSNAERRLEMERSAMRFISALTMESIINHISVLNPQRNLSHDQTLQFKSLMLNELNFVMNYVFTLETWYSFFVLGR